jgi:hypothetical protein
VSNGFALTTKLCGCHCDFPRIIARHFSVIVAGGLNVVDCGKNRKMRD